MWIIAETADLPTKFAKIVVTDYQGRYVLPDLPKASYSVWVRGYGLVDSPKVRTVPGTIVNLTAVAASGPAVAAEYYPALYWYSLLKIPDKSEFPGTGPNGNGMPVTLKNQGQWLDIIKTDGCFTCHQIGDKATRTIPKEVGHFDSSAAAWERRIQSGQASSAMVNAIGRLDTKRALALFADWTDRIAAGELPAVQPQRPQGVERNVVISIWDWATPTAYLHDEISTDKRNPTVNANGLIYGSPEESTDFAPILDPAQDSISEMKIPVRDPNTPSTADDPILTTLFLCRRRIGEARRSGAVRLTLTIQCSTNWGGCGLHPESVRRAIRPSAKQGRTFPRRSCFRSKVPGARRRCTIRKPKGSC